MTRYMYCKLCMGERSDTYVWVYRCWQLLTELNSDLSTPTMNLVVEHLAYCKKHHLPRAQAFLTLAKTWVCMGCTLTLTGFSGGGRVAFAPPPP